MRARTLVQEQDVARRAQTHGQICAPVHSKTHGYSGQ